MHHIGIDLVEIERVRAALSRWGDRFLQRVFTPAERDRYRDRVPDLAARFAAKEAVMKALGTGVKGVAWRDIEVLPDEKGKPLIFLYGGARKRADQLGINGLEISLSHSRDYAIASVIGGSSENSDD